jgi:DNA-binding CsgD family transcriptional regulator
MQPCVAILDGDFNVALGDHTRPALDGVVRDAARQAVAESRPSIEAGCPQQRFVVHVARLDGPASLRYAVFVEPRRDRRPLLDAYDRFGLTAREIDVLSMIMDGASNREIASALCIVEGTVQDHVRRLSAKAGTRRRGELLAKVFGIGAERELRPRPAQQRGDHTGLRASAGLGAEPFDVVADGQHREPELSRDLTGAVPAQQERQHVAFPRGQSKGPPGDADRVAFREALERRGHVPPRPAAQIHHVDEQRRQEQGGGLAASVAAREPDLRSHELSDPCGDAVLAGRAELGPLLEECVEPE